MTSASHILTMLPEPPGIPVAITPAQRWASARTNSYGAGDYGVLYLLVLGLLATVAMIIIVVLIRRWILQRRRMRIEFQEQCERVGLGEEEVNLLTFAVKLVRLRSMVNIVLTEAVFHRCMHALVGCERVSQMSASDKSKILSVINSAQLKLGFEGSASLVASRQIPEGATITLTGPGIMQPVPATIISAQGWEIKAQATPVDVDLPTGASLTARYNRAGSGWEFPTTLIHAEDRDLTLAHAKSIRFVNRRRFRRVRLDRPAMIAPYSFLTAGTHQAPKFYQARLVEFGAAGIVIEAEDFPATADKSRVLVVMEPRQGRAINTIGIVLRSETITSRQSRMVIELTDLSETDVSELVSETNLADQQAELPTTETTQQAGKETPQAQPSSQAAWRQ